MSHFLKIIKFTIFLKILFINFAFSQTSVNDDFNKWLNVYKEDAKALMLSVWDSKDQETLRIDLWTKEMPVDEMKKFFHQTLVSMSDTYFRATQDDKMRDTMKDFCDYFAEKTEIKKS